MIRALFLAFVTFVCNANAAEIPMNDAAWDHSDGMQFGQYLDRESVMLSGGVYAAKDTNMRDGRIDVDVAMHGQRGFFGVVFRYQSDSDYELIYLRPHKSNLPDALQYTPVLNGVSAWQLYSGEGFTAAAEMPHNRWLSVSIIISGQQVSVFLDGREEPALVVQDLKGDFGAGAVGLWGRNVAHFSNFRFTPAKSVDRSKLTVTDVPDNALTRWHISPAYKLEKQPDTQLPEGVTWQAVSVESGGLLNLSRYRARLPFDRDLVDNKTLVFARTNIKSGEAGYRKLNFGYSDEITILLNGQPLYTGKSAFSHRYPFSLGIVGLNNDAVYLPLVAGDNELMFAVSELFGGWGFKATLD